ncbi:MAG: N-acetyltransferase [Chitinophagaceae bacterium]|nr:N-acetyltransferase [Chitinophagaceae bacterium]
MEIKHETIENAGRFYIEEESINLAQLDYQLPGRNILQIMHTEVSKNVEGQGVGKLLVLEAVTYARKNSLMIKPICSFAKVVLDRGEEFADVYNAEKDD